MKIKNNKTRKREGLFLVVTILFGILILNLVLADENFNETRKLIDSNISCDKLTNEQLEAMGDYYMEQMHPGEAHELMHEMMGGEDSDTIKSMHINMAKSIYCGESNSMMGMMNMMSSDGMMSSGMMNMMGGGMMSSGMMGGYSNNYSSYNPLINFSWIFSLLIIVLLVLLIIWLFKQIQRK